MIPSINGILEVRTANVRRFSVGQALEASSTFLIDGNEFEFDLTARGSILHFERDLASYKWEVSGLFLLLVPGPIFPAVGGRGYFDPFTSDSPSVVSFNQRPNYVHTTHLRNCSRVRSSDVSSNPPCL